LLRGEVKECVQVGAVRLKLGLPVQEWQDINGYVAAKSEVLQETLERAGMNPEDRSAIDRVNEAT
jgi:hypothetical protein